MIKAFLFAVVFLGLSAFVLAQCHGAETLYYTTSGAQPLTVIDPMEFTRANNPPCPEWLKKYDDYNKFPTEKCGEQRRYRTWTCEDGTKNKGADIEHLPTVRCK